MIAIFVAGTGTEVGKTWIATRLIATLRERGHAVSARKPAQSFAPSELGHTDAELLGAATGESPFIVCPERRWYGTPMAPPMAAAALGRPPFTVAELARETKLVGLTILEGAGGPRSPLAVDGDNVDFARASAPVSWSWWRTPGWGSSTRWNSRPRRFMVSRRW